MTAIGYVRVSTDKQADAGVSLEAQEEKVRAMSVVQGADLQEVIVDPGESGKTLDRPGMAHLLDLVDSGAVDTVIVAKLDRLTRSVRDLGDLLERFQKYGVSLVSLAESLDTNTAGGRLVINIMMSVSQWEREAIGERTRAALRYKKAKHQVYSPTPFGFERRGESLNADAEEAATVAQIQAWRRGGWSLRRIAGELDDRKMATNRGGHQWYASTIRRILSNPIHVGGAEAA